MKKLFILLVIGFLFVVAAQPLAQAATIRISTPKIELELEPGETYSGDIIAENPTEEPLKAKVYLEDWVYVPGGNGEKRFAPAGTTAQSASSWITFTPSQETIPAYGRITARYTIKVPQDAKGGFYSVMFFETILGSGIDTEGVNVLVAGRIGALFFIHIKGTVERQGDIQSVDVNPPSGNKPMEITTTFKNTGNIDVNLGGKFLIMDAEGKILGRGDLARIYTFPGATESGKTQWVGRLSKGSYQLLLTYDLGKGTTVVKEQPLVIS